MFEYFRKLMLKRKLQSIKTRIDKKYITAVEFQRNGNLKGYAQAINEVQQLEKDYEALSVKETRK